MDQLYTYEILQELKKESLSDNWGFLMEILVQGIVLCVTIIASIKLSKMEFSQQIEIKENEDKIIEEKISLIIKQAISKELKQIDENICIITNHLSADLSKISSLRRVFFNPVYLESLLRIDYFTLVKVLENKFHGSGNVVDFVSSIQDATLHLRNINKYQELFADKFSIEVNDLNAICMELMRVVRQAIEENHPKSELLKSAYENYLRDQFLLEIDRQNLIDAGKTEEIKNNIALFQKLSSDVLKALMPINNFNDPIYLSIIHTNNSLNKIDFYTRGYKDNLAASIDQVDTNKRILETFNKFL